MDMVKDMLLKKKYWWMWLVLFLAMGSFDKLFLSYLLGNYEEDAWYMKGRYWIIGILFFFFPFMVMLGVFLVDMTSKAAAKLEVPGKEIYLSPFIWLLCLIVPVIGWIAFIVLLFYLDIAILVELALGKGEKYLEIEEK